MTASYSAVTHYTSKTGPTRLLSSTFVDDNVVVAVWV